MSALKTKERGGNGLRERLCLWRAHNRFHRVAGRLSSALGRFRPLTIHLKKNAACVTDFLSISPKYFPAAILLFLTFHLK